MSAQTTAENLRQAIQLIHASTISPHTHNIVCEQCEKLKATLDEMEESIKKLSSHLYSQEQKHDLLYDFERSKNDIFLWKSHALRSVNQKSANKKPSNQSLLLMTG